MAGASSWSSSCSCTSSLGSLDDDDVVCVVKPGSPGAAAEGSVKFLCSYGGMILPRHPDGALRYVGGNNRVLSVDRPLQFHGKCLYQRRLLLSIDRVRYSAQFSCLTVDRSITSELQRKLTDMCGWEAVSLRCQLPTEDLDALVSVTTNDDLGHLLEEYDAASRDRLQPLKIRAFLFPRAKTPPLSPSTPSSRPTPSYVRHQHHHTARPPPARVHSGHRRPHQLLLLHNGSWLQ
uniref:PB1 domain-containing protein n=1 Tax=Aegilops tauschii subsp. strangulata TaxID=200361 RepID=A0A453P1B1_AEGTS